MPRQPPTPKLRRDVWDTMSLCERAVRKAQITVDKQIEYDANRHGGVLRLIEAREVLKRVRLLCADHEDML